MNRPDDETEEDLQDFFAEDGGAPVCQGCGCSEFDPCEGGCVWATPDLCSRCVR